LFITKYFSQDIESCKNKCDICKDKAKVQAQVTQYLKGGVIDNFYAQKGVERLTGLSYPTVLKYFDSPTIDLVEILKQINL
jgi:hypothetical protein